MSKKIDEEFNTIVQEENDRIEWLGIIEKCNHDFGKGFKCAKCNLINASLEKRITRK